jgi:hypothetical protein
MIARWRHTQTQPNLGGMARDSQMAPVVVISFLFPTQLSQPTTGAIKNCAFLGKNIQGK